MDKISIQEFKKQVIQKNYQLSKSELIDLVNKLYDPSLNKKNYDMFITVTKLKYDLEKLLPDTSISYEKYYGDYKINIKFKHSELEFKITNKNELILIKEDNHSHCNKYIHDKNYKYYNIYVGEPKVDDVLHIVNMFANEGRKNNQNAPFLQELINKKYLKTKSARN